jgi:hypothetical protein
VEPLFFPILFLHGERGWTKDLKDRITAEEYVMWRLLMPEKYGSEYMTAMAVGPPFEILDSQTGYPFLPNQKVVMKTMTLPKIIQDQMSTRDYVSNNFAIRQ